MTQFKKYRRDASFFLLSLKETIELNKLCKVAKFLDNISAIPATSSNFSLKINSASFLISKSGIHKRDLNPSCFVRVNLEGKALTFLSPKPSDETLLHALVYRLFPDIQVVAHCHAREFEKFRAPEFIFEGHELLKTFGFKDHLETHKLPVFRNSQDMQSLSIEIEKYFKDNKNGKIFAFMLEKHGIYCFASSIDKVQNYLEAIFHLAYV